MGWADAGHVYAVTGETVTDADLAKAGYVIDLYSNTTPAASGDMRARDVKLLRDAHAWQASWQAGQVDVPGRMEVRSLDQDGVRVTPANEDSPFLAHFARLAVCRLSWMRTRSVSLRRAGDAGPDARAALTGDTRIVDHDGEQWEPL